MDINTVNNTVDFLVNRAQTGNTTPARKNLAYKLANISMFKHYNNMPEEWQPGQPVAKIAFSLNSDVESVMSIFKKVTSLYIDPITGQCNKPPDFIKESTLTFYYTENGKQKSSEVDVCNDRKFQGRLTNYVVPANKENPACVFVGPSIQFAPKNLINVEMLYLRMPVTPVWAFSYSNNRPVYDAANSVDPEFPDSVMNDFIFRVCQFLGVNMERAQLFQEMQLYKEKGQ